MKDLTLKIRISKEDYSLIESTARERDITVSKLVRETVLDQIRNKRTPTISEDRFMCVYRDFLWIREKINESNMPHALKWEINERMLRTWEELQ